MIKFLQVADSLQKIEEIVKKADAIIKQAEEIAKEPTQMENIVGLLDIIIWPITLIASLFLFKKQIASIIDRFKSAKVSAQGVEVLIEDKLQDATKLIGIGSTAILSKSEGNIIPKEGGNIIPKSGETIIPKSGEEIVPKRSYAESPYQELIELQDAINQKLKDIATQNGISSTGYSNFALTSDLEDHNIIESHTSKKLKTLIELNTIGLNSSKATHNQVSQMKKLFNNISF